MPAEKARWSRALARVTSNRAGSAKTSGSRLAAPSSTVTRVPARTSRPATTASAFAVRPVIWTGLSCRSTSSTALSQPDGVGQQRLPLVAVGVEQDDGVAEQVHRGLEARAEQQHHGGVQLPLGERLVVGQPDQPADQVVAGLAAQPRRSARRRKACIARSARSAAT